MSVGEFLFRATISHDRGNAKIGFFLMLGEREKVENTNKRKALASFSFLIVIKYQICLTKTNLDEDSLITVLAIKR